MRKLIKKILKNKTTRINNLEDKELQKDMDDFENLKNDKKLI